MKLHEVPPPPKKNKRSAPGARKKTKKEIKGAKQPHINVWEKQYKRVEEPAKKKKPEKGTKIIKMWGHHAKPQRTFKAKKKTTKKPHQREAQRYRKFL